MKYNGKEYYSQGDIYTAIEEQNKLLKEENRKLKAYLNLVTDERDNAFKKIGQLREKIDELELDYDRLKVAFEDVVSGE